VSDPLEHPRHVLVTGASGYVGGRLVPRLLADGHRVRCLVRTPAKLVNAPWLGDVEVVRGSIDGPLEAALAGIDTAVYLVHGIGDGPDWVAREARDAEHFRRSCESAGVQRIVYLGGMGADDSTLSAHLASRHLVGRTLADGPIPVTELRAAVIIGSGSASFEMLRYLVEVLPVMVTPKWVSTKSQPIAISDVLDALAAAIQSPEAHAGVFEIGGPDIVSYAEMMATYAEIAGLKRRRLIPVPFLTPRLSSHWVGLVTPVPASLARPLVDSLINEVVVRDPRALELLGHPKQSLRDAISLALGVTSRNEVPTSFSDADLQSFRTYATDPDWAGGTELTDRRVEHTSASRDDVFDAITSLGGAAGWHQGEWLWRARGFFDLLWGGPGLRRGRRHPSDLHAGDHVDFWRVEELQRPDLVKLHAEMVLPGDAWLQWTVETDTLGTTVTQLALFKPRGLLGRAYWFVVAPFHFLVFPGLLRGIVHDAEQRARAASNS
jgi:uncharacterized protein YbjT (DUF2867 family)